MLFVHNPLGFKRFPKCYKLSEAFCSVCLKNLTQPRRIKIWLGSLPAFLFLVYCPVRQEVILRYCEQQEVDLETTQFSVLLQESDVKLRIRRGRPRKGAKRAHCIHLQDVLHICQLSCERSVFTVMGKTFRQQRGATIGNQISPTLANLTVSLVEQKLVEENLLTIVF